jgi:hypothetical protein
MEVGLSLLGVENATNPNKKLKSNKYLKFKNVSKLQTKLTHRHNGSMLPLTIMTIMVRVQQLTQCVILSIQLILMRLMDQSFSMLEMKEMYGLFGITLVL